MAAPAALRTFVYGSCVSRDTLEYLRPLGYGLVDYVARHGLVTAFDPVPVALDGPVATTSSFQRRMIELDHRRGLVPLLESVAERVDVLLWDLCDERLGLRRLPDGAVVTRSVDLLSTGLDARLAERSTLVGFGTPEHRRLWQATLPRWRELLERTGLLDRLVLLAPPWAARAVDGSASPTSFGRTPDAANPVFAAYTADATAALGCPVVTLPEEQVRSDPDHQWGFAPFHYAEATYTALAAAIDEVARRGRPHDPAPTA